MLDLKEIKGKKLEGVAYGQVWEAGEDARTAVCPSAAHLDSLELQIDG